MGIESILHGEKERENNVQTNLTGNHCLQYTPCTLQCRELVAHLHSSDKICILQVHSLWYHQPRQCTQAFLELLQRRK